MGVLAALVATTGAPLPSAKVYGTPTFLHHKTPRRRRSRGHARSNVGSRTNTIARPGASISSPSIVKMVCPLITAKNSSWPFV